MAAAKLPPPPAWKKKLFSVGITGTNGKTSTTRFVSAALGGLARPVGSVTTVGSFLDDEPFASEMTYGGFLSVMEEVAARGGRFVSLEMTSEALARGFARAWPCEVGVFTNLTHDHLDAHGSPEHYLASKAQLFVALPPGGVAVLNGCDPASALLAEVLPGGVRRLVYGVPSSRGEPALPLDLVGHDVTTTRQGTRVRLAWQNALAPEGDEPSELVLRAIGEVFAENALAALVAAIAAGVPRLHAIEQLERVAPPAGRFEVVADPPFVVVDYAHTPDALARTLATARGLCPGKLTVVFGAGGNRDRRKREPMGRAAGVADRIVLTSDNPRDEDPAAIAAEIRRGIPASASVAVELDREKAIRLALDGAREEDVIVVAGKGHETEQTGATGKRAFSDPEIVRAILGASA